MMKNKEIVYISILVLLAAFSRFLVPDSLPNFTPIGAIALFSGAFLKDKKLAFIVPLLALFLSDIFVGFHSTMPFVYIGFMFIIAIGMWMKPQFGVKMIFGSLFGSILFFLITNLGYWLTTDATHSISGLSKAYIDGIPFFRNSLLGDLFFNGILFGVFSIFSSKLYTSESSTTFTKV
jgi:hypothetical protein